MFYRPNSPPVIQETIDEETLIVDLDSGSYYHLVSAGAYIWRLLEAGHNREAAAAALAEHFGLESDEALAQVHALIAELLRNELIVGVDSAPAGAPPAPAAPTKPYQPAALAVHTDMQELLLLDPVHDVDETGWPTRG